MFLTRVEEDLNRETMNELQSWIGKLIVAPVDVVLIGILLIDRCNGVKEKKRLMI